MTYPRPSPTPCTASSFLTFECNSKLQLPHEWWGTPPPLIFQGINAYKIAPFRPVINHSKMRTKIAASRVNPSHHQDSPVQSRPSHEIPNPTPVTETGSDVLPADPPPHQDSYSPSDTQSSEPKKRKLSPVREFYEPLPPEADKPGLRCKLCFARKRITVLHNTGSSTGALHNHLRSKHRDIYDKVVPAPKDSDIRAWTSGANVQYEHELHWDMLSTMIVNCNLPYSLVEHPAFQEYIAFLNQKAVAPSRGTIPNRITNIVRLIQPNVRALLDAAPGRISLTTDEWSSPNHLPFKCITCHWIDKEWRLREFILAFDELPGHHNADALLAAFTNVLDAAEWNIPMTKVYGITLDNASNNMKMVENLEKQRKHPAKQVFRCLAHVINLCCQAMLGATRVKQTADTIRKIAR